MIRFAGIVRHVAVAMVAAVAAGLCGCEHRELCYDHSHWLDLTFEFDWSKAPDADPRTMVVYLFPKDGGAPRRYEFGNRQKAVVRAPAGEYDAIALNGDTETLVERGATFETFEITTAEEALLAPMRRFASVSTASSNAPRFEATADEPVRQSPDMLWSAKRENVSVVAMAGQQSVRFTPEESTVTYHIILKSSKKLSRALEASAALSTMAEAYSPWQGMGSGKEVTVPIALDIVGEDSFEGYANFFGHCPKGDDGRRHILTVYTSAKKYFHFDVTDQVHEGEDSGGDVTIVVDAVPFPDPEIGAGMQPEVSDWSDIVNTDIDMN